jgi:hypothetical protein
MYVLARTKWRAVSCQAFIYHLCVLRSDSQAWIWATAFMYVLARTKWRMDRWVTRREKEREAAVQEQQDQEWLKWVMCAHELRIPMILLQA